MSDADTQRQLSDLDKNVSLIVLSNEHTNEALNEIKLGIAKFGETLAEHSEEDKRQFAKLKDAIDDALNGTDKENPGIFTRLHLLEGFRDRSNKSKWWGLGILSTVIGGIILTLILKHFS